MMRPTPAVAMDVCDHAADHGYVVTIVEGRFWRDPYFETHLDCIWMAKRDPPMPRAHAIASNALAKQDIEMESAKHSAFIVSVLVSIAPFRLCFEFEYDASLSFGARCDQHRR